MTVNHSTRLVNAYMRSWIDRNSDVHVLEITRESGMTRAKQVGNEDTGRMRGRQFIVLPFPSPVFSSLPTVFSLQVGLITTFICLPNRAMNGKFRE